MTGSHGDNRQQRWAVAVAVAAAAALAVAVVIGDRRLWWWRRAME